MNRPDIEAIRARCEKAGRGAWRADMLALLAYIEELEEKVREAANREPCWCQGE